MSKTDKGSGIPYAKTDNPIDIDGPSPSENSRLRAATAIQSSVKPGEYPAEKRAEQVAAATGEPAELPKKKSAKPGSTNG